MTTFPVSVYSLEMAKYTMHAASSASPVDLNNMSFSQSVPTVSTPTSMAVMAATTQVPGTINMHSPSTLQSIPTQHYAVPVSSLLGMKTLPMLAMHPAAGSGLPQGLSPYTTKVPTAGMKKSDRQKFAPYWHNRIRIDSPIQKCVWGQYCITLVPCCKAWLSYIDCMIKDISTDNETWHSATLVYQYNCLQL